MRSPIPLRRRAVFWLLLPAIPLLVIVARLSSTPITVPGSWTWTVGHSILLILVPAAVAATGAALEAARLRARRVENSLNARSPLPILIDALWPSYVSAILTHAIAVGVVALTAWGGRSAIPWGMIGAIAAMLFFHTCLGFAAGSILRPVFGIPVALAASYIWLGFTGTLPTFELRHLAGLVLETCCLFDQQPSGRSILAAVTFSVSAGVGLLLLAAAALRIVAGRMVLSAATGGVLVLAGLGTGLVVADGLPAGATEPRDPAELVCADGEVTVCLFPEQLDADVVSRVRTMVTRVRDEGVSLPATVVASADIDDDSERIRLSYMPGMTDEQLAGSLASDLPEGICAGDDVDTTIARDAFRSAALFWLERTMLGHTADDVLLDGVDSLDRLDDDVRRSVEALLDLPRADQAVWVNEAISSLRDCATPPPGAP